MMIVRLAATAALAFLALATASNASAQLRTAAPVVTVELGAPAASVRTSRVLTIDLGNTRSSRLKIADFAVAPAVGLMPDAASMPAPAPTVSPSDASIANMPSPGDVFFPNDETTGGATLPGPMRRSPIILLPGNGAVPEPATWAMMILGFGLVGSALRRRRAQVATA